MPEEPLQIKDTQGQDWTREEVQALVNQVASFTKAAARLGVTVKQLREAKIKTPVEYVRDRAAADPKWLLHFVLMMGSTKAAAAHFQISISTLESILVSQGYSVRLPIPDREFCLVALKKFGSVLYVARLCHTTPNLVKKAVPEWREYTDPTKAGNTSIRTGTIGERYYISVRADLIEETPSVKNPNHKGWDILDRQYGKVNVKTISANARGRWVWEIDAQQEADAFGLVQLDNTKTPVGLQVVTKQQILSEDLPRGLISTKRSNGDIAVSTVNQFPSMEQENLLAEMGEE